MENDAGPDIGKLRNRIDTFSQLFHTAHRKNYWYGNTYIILGAVLGALTVIAGLYDEGKIAAILGVLTTLHATIFKVFNFLERSAFYLQVANRADNLIYDLDYIVKSNPEKFLVVLNSFRELERHALNNAPRGGGMELIRDINPT